MLLANSEAAIRMATLGGKPRSEPRWLTGSRASSGPIVDFTNRVSSGTQICGRLRDRMPAATDAISPGTDWWEVFQVA
jgi:hypothetical protein